MRTNHSHPKFGHIDLTDWVKDLYTHYPVKKTEASESAPFPLPNPVVFKLDPIMNRVGNVKSHNVLIEEIRNLHLIDTKEDLDQLIELIKESPIVAIDTEFFAEFVNKKMHYYHKDNIFAGICISVDPIRGYYIPVGHIEDKTSLFAGGKPQLTKDQLVEALNSVDWSGKLIAAHNYKAETNSLHWIDVNIPFNYDTFAAAMLIDNRMMRSDRSLKKLTKRYFGYNPIEYSDIAKQYESFCHIDVDYAYPYAASDPVNTFRLLVYQTLQFANLAKQTESAGLEYSPLDTLTLVESPLMEALARMEQVGLSIDEGKLKELANGLEKSINTLQEQIRDVAELDGFQGSITSSIFKEKLFDEILRIPQSTTSNGTRDAQAVTNMEDYVNDYKHTAQAHINKLHALYEKKSSNKAASIALLIKAYVQRNGLPKVWRSFVSTKKNNSRSEHPHDQFSVVVNAGKVTRDIVKTLHRLLQEEVELRERQEAFLTYWKEHTRLSKLYTTYTHSLINWADSATDGLVHTWFEQLLNSGRMATSPNMQNLPADPGDWDIRGAFIAPEGYLFVRVDWSAVEMKITAALSKCPVLTGIVTGTTKDLNGKVIDIHAYTASAADLRPGCDPMQAYMEFKALAKTNPEVYSKRRKGAKAVNFGILYGIGAGGLAAQLKCSKAQAQKFIDGFLNAYPGVAAWMQSVETFALRNTFTSTWYGRLRHASREAIANKKQLLNEMRALRNHEIQGTSADIAKMAIATVDKTLAQNGFKSRLSMMIHDELIAICPVEEAYDVVNIIVQCMTTTLAGVELDVDPEITKTLSKKAINLMDKELIVMQPKLDANGETVYKDGKAEKEAVSVPNQEYLQPPQSLKEFERFDKLSSGEELISLLSVAHSYIACSGVPRFESLARTYSLVPAESS